MRGVQVLAAAIALAGSAWTQSLINKPPVVMAPVDNVQVRAGTTKDVPLDFRVAPDFHINSHTPKSELLIPTVLKLSPPEKVTVADVKYPAGQDMSFAFSPNEKLSVYSGDFSIDAVLKVPADTQPGSYPMSGQLRFQACDHSACYPPRTIPVQFQVMVVK